MLTCREVATRSAVLLCAVLSSCVHYHPRPLTPVQSETAYRQRSLADADLGAFVRSVHPGISWPPRTLSLANAVVIAAYFNPSLEIARSHIRTAEAALITAGGRLNPGVSSSGGYETSPESPLTLRFELSLPIETARKRSYRILEAAKLADAARVELNEASWRVYSQVRDAWMDYISSLDAQEARRGESKIRARIISLTQARLSAGESSRTQLDLSRAEASQAIVNLIAADGQVVDSRIRLASAMGLAMSALEGVQLSSNDRPPQPIESLSIARVQQKGLLNRLDVQRGLIEYAAAEAHLQLEVARQYPDIQLNPGYNFDEGHHKFTFGPTFPVPVWNRNRGSIAEAEARRAEAEAQFLALQSRVISDLDRSLAGYASAFSQFQQADQRWNAIQSARERATVRRLEVGEEDQFALSGVRLEGVTVFQARINALTKTRAAFSALEDAVQAPLDDVPWMPAATEYRRQQQQPRSRSINE